MIRFKRCYESLSPIPARANPGDAGLDICTAIDFKMYPGDTLCVPTGWSVSFPADMYLRIAPRSGLALKYHIDILAGVIDSGYRDEIRVVIHRCSENHNQVVDFKSGDRIAQLIPTALAHHGVMEVDDFDDDDYISNRGGGFGSTGIRDKWAEHYKKSLIINNADTFIL